MKKPMIWRTKAGYEAVIKKVSIEGLKGRSWYCGYVGLPKTHKLYGKFYYSKEVTKLLVHGGVTHTSSQLLKVPSKDLWWIGFDCAHWGDGLFGDGKKKSKAFCVKECEKLAEQLKELEKSMK